MSEFKQYKRVQIAELREVTDEEVMSRSLSPEISLSPADRENGSPLKGDMIARNPKNHDDKWLVARQYFIDNFEEIKDNASDKQVEKSNNFEVGQWIRNTYTNRVFEYSYADLQYDIKNPSYAKGDVLWEQEENEWCWWLNFEGNLALHKGYKRHDGKIVADLGFGICKDYQCLEPFIGRLPNKDILNRVLGE